MTDWAPVFVGVVLFILLSPGLLFQVPGRHNLVEFGNFQTSGISILVHATIFFALISIFLCALGLHVYIGSHAIMLGVGFVFSSQEELRHIFEEIKHPIMYLS